MGVQSSPSPSRGKKGPRLSSAALVLCSLLGYGSVAEAHPHVFVDGGVNFVLSEDAELTSVQVRWLFDPFETLYNLANLEIMPLADGTLDDASKAKILDFWANWPDDFEGATHLSVGGENVRLSKPVEMEVNLVDGRLELLFERQPDAAIPVSGKEVEVAFYESTYFYAFAVSDVPNIIGSNQYCSLETQPAGTSPKIAAIEQNLFELDRNDTPFEANIGSYFADRIILKCD